MEVTMSTEQPANGEAKDGEVRRSGRKRVSTIMKINGQHVLVKNNYVVTASAYETGAFVADDDTGTKKQKTLTPRHKKAHSERKMSPIEMARMKHNEAVKASIKKKEASRRDFLVNHKDVLEPFMDDPTRAMLERWANSKTSSSTLRKEELFMQPDLITGGEMRDYQLTGLNFLVNLHRRNIGMILGDEMGLGKTLQTISFLCHLKEQNENTGPSLIVCPLSVLYSWCAEFRRWAPSLKVLRLHSANPDDQAEQRKLVADGAQNYDAIVTTYDMVKVPQMMSLWKRIHFRILCLDEGHKIKSGVTLIAQMVRKIHCENRLLLTGTPLQNNLTELVSLLNFLMPDIFTNFKPFADAFDITNNLIDKEKMIQAQKVLGIFMLRRLKTQVEKLMPKKIETKVYCPLSNSQVFWYKSILMKDINALAKQESQGENGATSSRNILLGLFMQLRKACLHPFLFEGAEGDIRNTTLKDLIEASGKLAVLDSLLISLFHKGHRCVVFSQFTSLLDILADYCTLRGWKHLTFDGRTARARRNYYVNAFNAPNSPYFLFLMSTRSGSMGLNLQTADTCILFDSDMNPQMDMQAMARVHRIGQTKTVHVYRLVASGTVEERMLQRAEKKLLLDQMVNRERSADENGDDEKIRNMSAVELLKDIKFGSAAVFGDSSLNTLPSKKDILNIIDRHRTEVESKGNLKGNVFHQGDTFDVNQQLSDTQVFQGIDFRQMREEKEKKAENSLPTTLKGIARLWNEIADIDGKKRESKKRIIMVEGKNTGYGLGSVPVLASNNYELSKGESSVFGRELASSSKNSCAVFKRKVAVRVPEHQDFCQHCGDGGLLYLCRRCPVAAHKKCCKSIGGVLLSACSHHACAVCAKHSNFAGGLLYPCQSCPNAYCEDCLPSGSEGFRFLGSCPRFEDMGYDSTKTAVYIHCSEQCERYAELNFGWKKDEAGRGICPDEIDVSMNFGGGNSLAAPIDLASIASDVPPGAPTETSSSSSDCGSSSDIAAGDEIVDLTGE